MAARSDEPDVNVEYFQVLEDGKGLHSYSELPLMAISYLADPSRRVLQGIVIKEGAWVVSRIFTEEQAPQGSRGSSEKGRAPRPQFPKFAESVSSD